MTYLSSNSWQRGAAFAVMLVPMATTVAAAAEGGPKLEEIVVTAQRRLESQQAIPIAVSTVTAAAAKALGVTDMQAVVEQVPGLTYNRISNSIAPFLRGVGQTAATIGNEPSVATFIDDTYIPNGFAGFYDFNSMERVEVLKGPQGTLFGRNATGGVLNVHTRDPSHTPSADISLTAANYGTYGAQFYGNTGLGEKVAVNLAAYGKDQKKGWGRNFVTGNDVYEGYSYGARLKVLLEPGERTSVLVAATLDKRIDGQGISAAVPPGFFGIGGFVPVGFYNTANNTDNYYRSSFTQGSAKIRHDFDSFSVVSISAYNSIYSYFNQDTDVTPVRLFDASINEWAKTYTQELQLVSPEGAQLRWIVGVFYLNDDASYHSVFTGSLFPATAGTKLSNQKTNSISGFGQATAEIAPRTNLTLGLRYTVDKRNYTAQSYSGAALTKVFVDSAKNANLTGRIALDYHLSEDVMIYGAYNRGFKSGIFNLSGLGPTATSSPPAASPETLNAYTAGLKSEWWNNRVRINLEGYYYDYKNIQVQTTVGAASLITNAGAATLKGFELEISSKPIENLTISAAVGVARGRYDAFPGGPKFFPLPPNTPVALPAPGVCVGVPPYPPSSGANATAQRVCNLAGNKTVNTPPFTTNLSVSYRLMAGDYPIDLAASWAHGGDYFFEPDNGPISKQKVTDIVNTSLQLSSPNEKYAVRVWAKNLTNQEYFSYLQQSTNAGSKYSPAPPRTYGITLEGHF